MHPLPHSLYRADQVRELDRIAIEECGIPSATLMERAGAAAFAALADRWPGARRIAVLCGTGNNGGDGFVLARLACEAGREVEVYQVGEPERLRATARAAAEAWRVAGGEIRPWTGQALDGYEVIVDGLLGTGLSGEVSGAQRAAIEAINTAGTGVLALDIPSGLHADSGTVLGAAVAAHVTVTFIGLKQGLFTGAGPDCCGVIRYSSLDVPVSLFTRISPAGVRLRLETLSPLLRPRPRGAHKGLYGHVLIVGGAPGMTGAARLAGEAALRTGAGLVSVATDPGQAGFVSVARPELMAHAVADGAELRALLARATVIAIGPGLGRSAWARALLAVAIDTRLPLVADADALNLLAENPARRENWVLTPHPGEAGRLLGRTAAEVQADRFEAVRELQRRYGGVVVLKGAGTLICDHDGAIALCDAGNPGMASGGMGDALTGVIAALLAQRMALPDAACMGVLLHAAAGDRAAAIGGERGLIAGDLMVHLHHLANPALSD